jgi:hypothetical protein
MWFRDSAGPAEPLPVPLALIVTERGECRHCHKPIEKRNILGWTHVEGLFLCAVPTDVGDRKAWKHAEPVE